MAAVPITPTPSLFLFDLDDTLCDYTAARDGRLRLAFRHAIGRAAGFADAAASAPRAHSPASPDGSRGGSPGVDIERLAAASVARDPHGSDHFADLLRDHGLDDPAVAEAARDWYRANRFHGLALFEDAEATLLALRRTARTAGARIGLVTNGPSEVQRAKITLLAVERLVDFVLVSEEVGSWKPEAAIFAEALRRGGAGPDDALFIGDSLEHDMAGAAAAGIRTVWSNRHGRTCRPGDARPDHEVVSLAEVLTLLGIDGPPDADGSGDTG